MEFWKNACSIEKELVFIVLKDFGIKPRTRNPDFYAKAYRMNAEDASALQELCEKYGIKKVSESYPDWMIDYHRKRIIELAAELKENIRCANEVYPYYREEYIDRRLKKYKKIGLPMETIENSYRSWRGNQKKCYYRLKKMDELYKQLYGKEVKR